MVTGTITVPNNTYWSTVKLGAFSGGTLGAYPALNTSETSGVGSYRIIYSGNTGVARPVLPLAGTSYSITGTGDFSRDYSFELPTAVPQLTSSDDERYFYAAWVDGNGNDTLDLADQISQIAFEEHNRCATKATTNTHGVPTTITINFFMQSTDSGGNPSGNYKYNGHDLDSIPYNEAVDLTTDNNNGFNFTISAASGW
jgi:hypothetical protein